MPYLSALEVLSRQGAIQIHVYLYLTFTFTSLNRFRRRIRAYFSVSDEHQPSPLWRFCNSSASTNVMTYIFDNIRAHHSRSHLVSVVGPRAELESAQLFVERVELDVDGTRTLIDCRRFPVNFAVWKQRRFCHQGDLVTPISAAAATTP